MAAADKTYMNLDTYKKFRAFWIQTYNQQIDQLGEPIYMYPLQEFEESQEITPDFLNQNEDDLNYFWKPDQERTVLSTSSLEDAWLYQNCDFLDFSFMGKENQFSRLMDFTEKETPYIVSMQYGDRSQVYFWTHHSSLARSGTEYDEEHINVIEHFHVFGSTDFFKFWHTAKKIASNNFYYDHLDINSPFEVEFFAYGRTVVAKKEKDTCRYYINDEEIDFNVKIPLDKFFFPKFNYHTDLSEIEAYTPEEVILSMYNEFTGLDRYKNTSNPIGIAKREFSDTFVEEILK